MNLKLSLALWLLSGLMIAYGMLMPDTQVQAVEVKEEVVQYATERETHLYNKVDKTVDLPWFGDYQDLLASYAYNTCKRVIDDTWKYSCENLVKTRNAENGWWRRDATNTSNRNGTYDGGLCQLNSAYHMPFIKSERFANPLAQLDYCLQVRVDAKKKNTMPRYAYHVRHQRDKGITFITSSAGSVEADKSSIAVVNTYEIARQASIKRQEAEQQLILSKQNETKMRGDCIESKQCK